jgi:hypothetical protein
MAIVSEGSALGESLARGWVDAPTNCFTQNVLTSIDIIDRLAGGRSLPSEYLPLFFHEITHHWCFQSCVGSALTLLREQTYLLLRGCEIQLQNKAERALQETIFRYEATRHMLMPWIEGIAQFAEFDATLGESPAYSMAAQTLTTLFLSPDPSKSPTVENLIELWRETIKNYRLSDDNIGRKKLLLESPFAGSSRGVYLRGYLLVKKLHGRASEKTSRFADTDLFVAFVRNLIFADAELGELLLAQPGQPITWLNATARRLKSRIDVFDDPQLDRRVAEFEARLCESDPSPGAIGKSIDVESSAFARFNDLLTQWQLPPSGIEFDQDQVKSWKVEVKTVLALRSLIRLAVQNIQVSVGREGKVWVIVGPESRSFGPKEPSVADGDGSGLVALYYVPPQVTGSIPGVAMLVMRGKEVVRVGLPRILWNETGKMVVALLRLGVLGEAYFAEHERTLSDAVSWFDALPGLMARVQAFEENLTANVILSDVPHEQRGAVRGALTRAGLYELLERERGLIDFLAAIGAHRSADEPISTLIEALAAHGFDFDGAVRRIFDIQRKTGFSLLREELSAHRRKIDVLV